MLKLLRYLKNYKKETILAPLFKMIEAIFDLLVPVVVARLIDYGIRQDNVGYVWKMGGLLVMLAFLGMAFAITAQYFAAKAAAGFGTELRSDLFAHIQRFSYSQLDNQGTSTLITRMTSDINLVQAQVNMAIRLLLRSPFIVFGALIAAILVDAKTSLIFVIAIPVLSVIVYGIMLVTIPLYRKVQGKLDIVMNSTRENLNGVRVLRAFHKEADEIKRYNTENEALNAIQIFAGKISAIMNPATYIVVNLAIIGILLKGGERVDTGDLSQGQIVALVNYMSQILVELIKLAGLIINLTKAFACAGRINDVFAIEPGMSEGELIPDNNQINNCEYIIEFRDVSLTYEGAKECSITNVNLKVKKGETIGIIGGTGSGKTTLINMIPRLYDATHGEVIFAGENVKKYRLKELRKKISVVPQKALLFKGTVRSNLLWGNEKATEENLINALKASQSYDFVMAKEDGINEEVSQNGRNFSGGQRQRLTIARALVKTPEVLILDDSASALDFATEAKLREGIKSLNNITTFIVSQRASSIMHADQIVVLDDGMIMGVGNHEKLLQTCDVYKEIYYSQFPEKERGAV